MTSDISRQTFNPRKHYSGVVMQQGRVQLDADWNEQQDILLHHLQTQARRVIGANGASLGQDGFSLTFTPDGNDLIISPGSLYVDGMLCELEEGQAVKGVLSLKSNTIRLRLSEIDNQPFQNDHWCELLDGHQQLLYYFKIISTQSDKDKDELILTIERLDFPEKKDAIEQNCYVRPVLTYKTQPNYPVQDASTAHPLPDFPGKQNVFLAYLDVWQRVVTAFDDPQMREVALGGADTAQRSQTLWQVKIIPIEISSLIQFSAQEAEAKELEEAIKQENREMQAGREYEYIRKLTRLLRILSFRSLLNNLDELVPDYNGKLSVRTADSDGSGPQGYRGQDNQLYRVEIHEGSDDAKTPTFKWARDNASTLVLARVDDNHLLTIQGSGQGSLIGLSVGQYVELFTEGMELLGQPGHLARVQLIDDINGQITLSSQPPDGMKEAYLRVWNGQGTLENEGDSDAGSWLALENGIEVRFLPEGTYRDGDYWLIPARTATRQIDWPHTAPQPPQGVQHSLARLACLLHTEANALVQDTRPRAFPLAAKALHILAMNWRNDLLYDRGLLRSGLRFTLDGEPDQECAGAMQAAIIVSLETALPGGGSGIFLINGLVEIERNVITWHWDREEKTGIIPWALSAFDKWKNEWFERHERYLRVRVTIKGHAIWQTINNRRLYLDGQAFGLQGSQESANRPGPQKQPGRHIDLQFPSGAGHAASDFEGWFYMRE